MCAYVWDRALSTQEIGRLMRPTPSTPSTALEVMEKQRVADSVLDSLRHMIDRNITKELFNMNSTLTNTNQTFQWVSLGEQEEKKMRNNKWEFEAAVAAFIDFDKIAEELSGEHPIIFVNHGKTDKYVVVSQKLSVKASAIGVRPPEGEGIAFHKLNYVKYRTDKEFVKWLNWAKQVKAASWPPTQRKNDTVEVSLPQI